MLHCRAGEDTYRRGNQHSQGTTYTHHENCVQKSQGQKWDWNEYWAKQEAPQEKAQKEARDQHSKSLWIHEDAELGEASEKVVTLYHSWSAAAEEFIVKSSVLGNTKSCLGRKD